MDLLGLGKLNMTYETEILHKMQLMQLDIYKDFEKMCLELGLPFFVAYGAAIGAVRHKGFIPWDDDIDVGMLRSDYDRLNEYMKQNPNDQYELITPETQKGCVLSFGKFSKKGTECIELAHSYRNYQSGVAIDIFPYDATSLDEKDRKKHAKKTWIWNRIMVLAEYPVPTLPNNMGKASKWVCLKVCLIIHYVFRFLGITREKAYIQYLKNATKYNGREDVGYTDFTDLTERVFLDRSDIYPAREVAFEDTTILTMNNLEKALSQLYGTYMELPPENQRYNHPPKYVDFGDGFKYGEK